MEKIIVVGGGPAGIMAALTAAQQGASVELWERNQQLGRKLAITGKGRCNITNDTADLGELVKNIPGNGSFLYGALSRFTPGDVMDFFRDAGLPVNGRALSCDGRNGASGQQKLQRAFHVFIEPYTVRRGLRVLLPHFQQHAEVGDQHIIGHTCVLF